MGKIEIAPVAGDQLPPLLELNQANRPHVGSLSFDQLEHLHREAAYFRAVRIEGRSAGFLIALDPFADYKSPNYRWFRKRYTDFIYIDRIAVRPEGRRLGIATRMYRDLERFSAARGASWMACEYNLRPANEVSRAFHERFGFREVGRQETEGGKKTVSLQVRPVSGPLPGVQDEEAMNHDPREVFTPEVMERLMPSDRTDRFFDALFGDPEEGAYDISLRFREQRADSIEFEFLLQQRSGKCLVCSLTHGLPRVFSRHPVIDIPGLVERIGTLLPGAARCGEWRLGSTREITRELHAVPLTIRLVS